MKANKLPQVSWIVAPEAYTEHPNWPANYGAWYVSQMLDVLTSNPEVWSKTAFFLTYDENDGFFDHAVPLTVPPSSTQGKSTVDITNEIFTGNSIYPVADYPAGPYGMGLRVPMVVISPWSKGGYVNSEVFDHTSIIRFIEQRFGQEYHGLNEPNITPWRRAVAGDLTSAFNFKSPNDAKVPLPSTTAYVPPDNDRHPDYIPTPPTNQSLPAQEPGTRPARALPYELHVHGRADFSSGVFHIDFNNAGKTAVFQVRSGNSTQGPWIYTVGPRPPALRQLRHCRERSHRLRSLRLRPQRLPARLQGRHHRLPQLRPRRPQRLRHAAQRHRPDHSQHRQIHHRSARRRRLHQRDSQAEAQAQ